MSSQENRNVDDLHPRVKKLALKLVEECKKQGINIKIGETYRTVARQDYLYAQGRTRPGRIVTYCRGSDMESYHQWRLAFDVFQNIRGQEYDYKVLQKVGKIGMSLGLDWGGAWTNFKDTPHFEFTEGLTIKDLKAGKMIKPEDPVQPPKPTPAWMFNGLEFFISEGLQFEYDRWRADIEKPMPAWAVFIFMKRMYLLQEKKGITNTKTTSIPTVQNWMFDGLEFFKSIGLNFDYERWTADIEKPMPTWAVFIFMKRMFILQYGEQPAATTVSNNWKFDGINFFNDIGMQFDYDRWKEDIDKDMPAWAIFILMQRMYLHKK